MVKSFKEVLQSVMDERNFDMRELATRTGCSELAVSKWLTGMSTPSFPVFSRIVEATDVDANRFFREDNTRNKVVRLDTETGKFIQKSGMDTGSLTSEDA